MRDLTCLITETPFKGLLSPRSKRPTPLDNKAQVSPRVSGDCAWNVMRIETATCLHTFIQEKQIVVAYFMPNVMPDATP
jgi:hypothetical protein